MNHYSLSTLIQSSPPPESPTVYDSDSDSNSDDSDDSDRPSPDTDESCVGHLQMPTCQSILDAVREQHGIHCLLEDSSFKSPEAKAVLFSVSLWEPIRQSLIKTLKDCFVSSEKQLNKMQKKYFGKKMSLILNDAANIDVTPFLDSLCADVVQVGEASVILQIICCRFVEAYHKLITTSSSTPILPIADQVKALTVSFTNKSPDQLLPLLTTREHSYYIIGFLGGQSSKEASRRKKGSKISECLTYFSSTHFITRGDDEFEGIIADESIPTGLVERRMAFGGLRCPSRQCWNVFAKIESMYSTLVCPENFLYVGGTLSRVVCQSIVNNETMQQSFFSLLSQSSGDVRDIDGPVLEAYMASFRYVMKVFSRVRGGDVSRKINSTTFRGNQVQFRAGIGSQAGKKKRKKKQHKPVTTDKDGHDAILSELNEMNNESEADEVTRKITTINDNDSDDDASSNKD